MDYLDYIARQLSSMFPSYTPGFRKDVTNTDYRYLTEIESNNDLDLLRAVSKEAEERFSYLASRVKQISRTGTKPDPLHVMKYPIYLYLLSRVLFERQYDDPTRLKDRLYSFNKAVCGCSIYYKISMPKVFFLTYATGVVLGDCVYGENLVVYQGCTIGGYRDKTPVLGNNVILMPNCVVSGSSQIGNNVVISAGVACVNSVIPDNHVVFSTNRFNSPVYSRPITENEYIDYFIEKSATDL